VITGARALRVLSDSMATSSPNTKRSRPVLLVNIGQLLTMRSSSPGPRRGSELKELAIIEDAAVLSNGGKIVSVGKGKDALRDPWIKNNRKKIVEIDCERGVVLPGFVDSHTHPAFMNPRLVDFEKRIAGASYEEIAEAGGGIRASVDAVRRASKSQLADKVLEGLRLMASQGTTTVEAKSGYGLNLESELKSLEAIRQAAMQWPGTVVSTLLGAHVVPSEFRQNPEGYVGLVCSEMIPQVSKRKLAQFVDVFTDRGAFSAEQTGRIFEAARNHDLGVRAHVCQLSETRLQSLLQYEPASFDHMD
jgi:imidazolonepropionase